MANKKKYFYILGSVTIATYSFLKIIEERYNPEEHLIYIPFGADIFKVMPQMREFENICFPPKGRILKRRLNELKMYHHAEHIILHGMFTGTQPLLPLLLLLLLFPKKTSKKLSWIEHGGDLYNWKYPYKSWKAPLINWMNRKIRESASVLGVCHPIDEAFLRSEFKTDAPCFYTQLRTVADPFALWNELKPPERDPAQSYPTIIQVGHNAFQLGNHIHILDMVEKFKYENIKIVLPMAYGVTGVFGDAYGGRHYRKAVNIIAKTIFTDKAVLFYKNIPQQNYYRYLWQVDIAIFDLYRQAGLGNLHPLLYMDKKIFLPAGTVMYDWLKAQNLEIYDTNQIPNMTFEEFIKPPSGRNREWVVKFLTENSYPLWDDYFAALNKATY